MLKWFRESRETTLCGLAAGVGLLLLILGLLFNKDEVWKAGITIVSATVVFMGVLARSQPQHDADAAKLKAELRADIVREVQAEVSIVRPPPATPPTA